MTLKISEEHDLLIKEFLMQWWLSFTQEAARTSDAIKLPSLTPDDLLGQELGRMLHLIALASEGKLEHMPDIAGEVSMAVFDLLEMLWSRPGCVELVDPPLAFWEGEFGYMVLQADVWASEDQLITMKEAASLMGGSLQALRGKVNSGVISEYREIHEPNPRRASRLRLRDVHQLAESQRK
jgi:hypothetical protein